MNRDFRSDNIALPADAILENVLARSKVPHQPYGEDVIGAALTEKIGELFEHEVAVFPILTGTAANALALAHVARSFGKILCHAQSHIFLDECGAVEFQGRGMRLSPLHGSNGLISPADLPDQLGGEKDVHQLRPGALSVSQATEAGTVYRPADLKKLSAHARQAGIPVHMDGTRFANALSFAGCSPADLSWRSGIDVLCIGATKGGAPGAEAVIFFDPELSRDFLRLLKRNGHLPSRLWFVSAQLEAYFTNHYWLRNASHANHMATRLAKAVSAVSSIEVVHPVETSMVFLKAEMPFWQVLQHSGYLFYMSHAADVPVARFVMSYDTDPDDVDRLAEAILAADREYRLRSGSVRPSGHHSSAIGVES